jgi:hypothetical protein
MEGPMTERRELGDEARLHELERRCRELERQRIKYGREEVPVWFEELPSMLPGGVQIARIRTPEETHLARLRREGVEQELNAIRQEMAGIRAEVSPAPKPRSLSPAKRNILRVLEAMPPEDLDSRQIEVLVEMVEDRIVADYGGVGRSRSTIHPLVVDFLQSRLSRRR